MNFQKNEFFFQLKETCSLSFKIQKKLLDFLLSSSSSDSKSSSLVLFNSKEYAQIISLVHKGINVLKLNPKDFEDFVIQETIECFQRIPRIDIIHWNHFKLYTQWYTKIFFYVKNVNFKAVMEKTFCKDCNNTRLFYELAEFCYKPENYRKRENHVLFDILFLFFNDYGTDTDTGTDIDTDTNTIEFNFLKNYEMEFKEFSLNGKKPTEIKEFIDKEVYFFPKFFEKQLEQLIVMKTLTLNSESDNCNFNWDLENWYWYWFYNFKYKSKTCKDFETWLLEKISPLVSLEEIISFYNEIFSCFERDSFLKQNVINTFYKFGFLKREAELVKLLDSSTVVVVDIHKVFKIFRFFKNKDEFLELYKNNLALKLLRKRNTTTTTLDIDKEKNFIGFLKQEMGPSYTLKIEKMLFDIHVQETGPRPGPEKILNFSSWPDFITSNNFSLLGQNNTNNFTTLKIHNFIKKTMDEYHELHKNNRILEPILTEGKICLRFVNGKNNYNITMNPIQAMIFDCIFSRKEMGIESTDILNSIPVSIPLEVLHVYLQPFLKLKLVKSSSLSSLSSKEATFQINTEFHSPLRAIQIPNPILKKKENDGGGSKQDLERKFSINSCIVRIMKSRKLLRYDDLVWQVISFTSKIFETKPRQVKTQIEELIESEYLERRDDEFIAYL